MFNPRRYLPSAAADEPSPPWATHDDFSTFERGADALMYGDGVYRRPMRTAADNLFMRDADRANAQPVLFQQGAAPPTGGLKPVPSQPAHGPNSAIFYGKLGVLKAFPSTQGTLNLWKQYPGALLDLADGVDEKFGAVRNPDGKLINGTGLPREMIAAAMVQLLPSMTAEEQARLEKFSDKRAAMTPADAAWLAGRVRQIGGPAAEDAARRIEDASRRQETKRAQDAQGGRQ